MGRLGQVPWNKGKTKRDLPQLSRGGRKAGCSSPWNKGKTKRQLPQLGRGGAKPGCPSPWNKGRKWSPEMRVKLSAAHKGYKMPVEQKQKISVALRGKKKSPDHCRRISEGRKQIMTVEFRLYMGKCRRHLTPDEQEAKRVRGLFYHTWRCAVYRRDNHTCQVCGKCGKRLAAHHIRNWQDNPTVRYAVSNGATACASCHRRFHREFGLRHTNEQQWAEFVNAHSLVAA